MLYVSFGNRPHMTNNQTASDSAFDLYRHFTKLRDQTVIEMMHVSAVSDTYQQLIGKREAYEKAAQFFLQSNNNACWFQLLMTSRPTQS